MYNFRTVFEREKNSTAPRVRHLQKKVEQHIKYGVSLGIPEEQIKEFNLAIIGEVKKRKLPKTIIETLIRENGRK